MNFFNTNKQSKIVPKQTTFTYSKKTPKQIIEERELKKTNILFNKINKDNESTNSFSKINKMNSFNSQNNFKNKLR